MTTPGKPTSERPSLTGEPLAQHEDRYAEASCPMPDCEEDLYLAEERQALGKRGSA